MSSKYLLGLLFTFNAVFTWAAASIIYASGLRKTDPKATLLFRLVMVSIATFLFSLIFGSYLFFSQLNDDELIIYLIMCLISGLSVTIGDIMYFISLKKIDASRAYPLIQLSLVFVYPFAFLFFGEEISLSILIGGGLILSSVFILSTKDKSKDFENVSESYTSEKEEKSSEEIFVGVLLAIGTAFFWALAIVSFHQARIITGDVFVTNFVRIFFATIFIAILGIFQREYYSGFKKENRVDLKYYFYIGIAGSLSLGLADSWFYKAAEINGLVLTSTITANSRSFQLYF